MRVTALLASMVAAAIAGPAASQTGPDVALGDFRSVELRNGGRVTVRHGAARAFRLREGNLETSRIEIEGGRLVVDRCRSRCPRGYQLDVEIVAPEVDALAVTDGGMLRIGGDFPSRDGLAVAVNSGGMVDARQLRADRVTASVRQGGGIMVRPARELDASIASGGIVTYFGEARVRSSVRDGGAVVHGDMADLERPLADLHPQPPALGPPPAIPPIPPIPSGGKD